MSLIANMMSDAQLLESRTAKLKDSWTRQIFIVPLRHVPENFPQSSLFRRSNTTQVTGRPCLSIHFHTARLRINVDPISEQNACYNELSTHTASITPTSLLFKCKAVEGQSKYWDLIWNFLPCNTSSNFFLWKLIPLLHSNQFPRRPWSEILL